MIIDEAAPQSFSSTRPHSFVVATRRTTPICDVCATRRDVWFASVIGLQIKFDYHVASRSVIRSISYNCNVYKDTTRGHEKILQKSLRDNLRVLRYQLTTPRTVDRGGPKWEHPTHSNRLTNQG